MANSFSEITTGCCLLVVGTFLLNKCTNDPEASFDACARSVLEAMPRDGANLGMGGASIETLKTAEGFTVHAIQKADQRPGGQAGYDHVVIIRTGSDVVLGSSAGSASEKDWCTATQMLQQQTTVTEMYKGVKKNIIAAFGVDPSSTHIVARRLDKAVDGLVLCLRK